MIDRNPKPGETWRDREGAVYPVQANDSQEQPLITPHGVRYTATGGYRMDGAKSPFDLIERVVVVPDPHPEPRVFWINVYALDGGSGFHTSGWTDHALADKHGGPDRIACVRVTEGQFDSDEASDAR